jgi:hypothetical protein
MRTEPHQDARVRGLARYGSSCSQILLRVPAQGDRSRSARRARARDTRPSGASPITILQPCPALPYGEPCLRRSRPCHTLSPCVARARSAPTCPSRTVRRSTASTQPGRAAERRRVKKGRGRYPRWPFLAASDAGEWRATSSATIGRIKSIRHPPPSPPLARPAYQRRDARASRLPSLRSAASPTLTPGHPAWCQ